MIFWKHIKGLAPNSGNSNIYNYIRFSSTGTTANVNNLPEVYLSTTNDFDAAQSCGRILTTNVVNGYINEHFEFRSSLNVKDIFTLSKTISNTNYSLSFSYTDSQWQINSAQTIKIITPNFILDSTEDVVINRGLTTNKVVIESYDQTHDGSCTAVYFNATSDYRAKRDFKSLNFDALKLINNTSLYSFKYKDSNLPSIGIIAQDVQDIDINGFKLVDNPDATGENMDYMHIHESKLVYILWKAIQEQQKEIEDLKKQLNK